MQITQIQQAKKDQNRVNVFLNDEFWIGLDKNELIEFQLFRGKEVDSELKKKIEEQASTTKTFNKVINLLSRRPRSEFEIKQYLKQKGIDSISQQKVIEKLISKELISDEKFAEWFIEGRISSGRYGEIKIKNELIKKGVSKEIIENRLSAILSDENLQKIEDDARSFAAKSINSIKYKDQFDLKNKLIRKLMSRGYQYSLSAKIATEML